MNIGKEVLTAIIIEDEVLARDGLKAILKLYCPNITVIGEADSVTTGLALLKTVSPDILFLDIILEDGKGFEILDQLESPQFHLIFVTSHNSYALKAFEYYAINYLLKPINPRLLVEAVQRLPIKQDSHFKKQIVSFSKSYRDDNFQQLVISTKEVLYFIDIKEIIRLESNGNLVSFYLENGQKIFATSKSLKDYEHLLPEKNFYRIHQSHIIQRKYVKGYVFKNGGYILISDGDKVPVSRRKRDDLIDWLRL